MSLQALSENLRELYMVHKQAYQLAEEKKEVLIKGDIDALAKIVQQENGLIKSMSTLEAERQRIVGDLIRQYNFPPTTEIRLSDLLEKLPNSQWKDDIQESFANLSSLLTNLQELNQLNQQLIENSLEFVNYSIDLYTDAQQEQLYHKPDASDDTAYQYRRSIFDTKA